MSNDTIAKLATTTTTETTAWIPRDVYAALIIEEAQKSRLLAGARGAVEHTQAKGTGKTVTVRFFPKRTAQGPIAENTALSLVASTPTTKTISIQKYGDAAELSRESIDQTSDDVRARFLKSMGNGLARKLDEVAYAELIVSGNANSSTLLAAAGTLGDDFRTKLSTAIDDMRKTEYEPNLIVLGVDQASALADIKAQDVKVAHQIQVGANGEVVSFRGVPLLVLPFANANAATLSMVQAVVLDTRVAFGEAFGLSPLFEEERIALRDVYQYTVWAEYGVSELEKKGIVHVKNPAA